MPPPDTELLPPAAATGENRACPRRTTTLLELPRGTGSIYPFRNGYAGYVWVTTPGHERLRRYVYGNTVEQVHARWIELHRAAAARPLPSRDPYLREYLEQWLDQTVAPFAKPLTVETYRLAIRCYINPTLGNRHLGKLDVADVRRWLAALAKTCQCCAQGKDLARPDDRRRCCAIGRCCGQQLSHRSVLDARNILRSALREAETDGLIERNPAALIRLPKARSRRVQRSWTLDEACRFLRSARDDNDPLYPAYVLLLVLGLRRGELLALRWEDVDADADPANASLTVRHQLQRIGGRLVLSETKTLDSEAALPLPEVCLAALRRQVEIRDAARSRARETGARWVESEHIVTTRTGTPLDPHNFYRSFQRRCVKAGVRAVPVHGTRHTCASLLVTLGVHPRVAMQILRHAKIATTMEVYTHVPTAETRAALRGLGDLLGRSSDVFSKSAAA